MFKFLPLFVLAVLAVAQALPVSEKEEVVPILNSEVSKSEDGSYRSSYESGDGTKREEEAHLVNAGTDDEALEVKGSYKYLNEFGETVEVFYTAGVNGFVPYGSIINPDITAVAEAAKDLPNDVDSELESKVKYSQ
ncbi:PREDICTED: larval cuticle protein 8 [Drosophila arizonae]|uniref:Larval cuticle protein 8 n=1 Tax=Drosophila arizonae TaxID=7263 RepID=A0ABM1PNA1_DROAR|nr:PREDICTED: larval cuticle protein 8 [Drosophila arizonae]